MDRARLAEAGIFIEDGDGGCELLPPHVESLQDALLDFRRTIPDRFGCIEEELLKLLDEDGINARDNISGDDHAEVSAELEFCAGVRELTNHLAIADQFGMGEYSEDDWNVQFEELVLDPWVEEAQVCDRDTRLTARTKFYYDSFQQARDRPWTLFGPDGPDGARDDLPEPKPAWVAHFPVYVISPAEYNHQHSGLRHFASSHSIVDNFSQVTLEHLAGHGLQPSATGVTKTGRRGAALSSEYVCFPWLIFEHMKDEYKGNEELCYSHAANAGAAALKMLKNLSKHDNQCLGEIPPVVTMTTKRDLVRVWIMHSAQSKGTCEMQLIWSGSLTRLVDIFELKAILENCQTWATRVLRPWVSRQIDLWKQQCPDDCPKPFDPSLRRRAAQSSDSSTRPTRDEDAPEKESKSNENKGADIRQTIREEHDRLLRQLSKGPVETKGPTRSIATQMGSDDDGHPLERPTPSMVTQTGSDDDKHPLEKSAVRPLTLNPMRPFPRRKILDPKPRLAKKTAFSGSPLSSDKGGTAPVGGRQETNDGQRQVSSVDLFKNTKKVYGESRIFTIKLPDVSSEEILAQKPWLGAKKDSEAEEQTETILTHKSEVLQSEVEKTEVNKDNDSTHNEKSETEENEIKERIDDSRDKKNDDELDGEKRSNEDKPAPSLGNSTEADTRSIQTTDDKGDPLKDTTEAVPISAGEDLKKGLKLELLISSKESSTYTEIPENEKSSEIAKNENPEESIENEHSEIPEKNFDDMIEKSNSEKGVEEEAEASPEGIMEEENPEAATENEISEESTKHEKPKETTEKEYSSGSVARKSSGQDPGNMSTKLPLPTPEPEPVGPLSPSPPAPAKQLVWRKDYGQNKDDDHKELGRPTIKPDTPPPRDGPVNTPGVDTPTTAKAAKSLLSPPAETKPSTVFDPTRWTHTKFAFGSSGHSKEPPFTFKMKTEGSAEDPRNASIAGKQASTARLFKLPQGDDDEPTLSENPRPVKLTKARESLAGTRDG